MGEQPERLQSCVRRVLNELHLQALLLLKDPRLEVMVVPEYVHSVWSYFPIHRRRIVARDLQPKPETRVLLLFSLTQFEKETEKFFETCLRDHLGHALLYLHDPKAPNECPDAMREWKRSVHRSRLSRGANGL